MRLSVQGRWRPTTARTVAAAKTAVTLGMRDTGGQLKQALRAQITAAGMGVRLGNTIRDVTYPKSGASLTPVAVVYSKAPHILSSLSQGTVIRALRKTYLAMPTRECPIGARGRKLRPDQAIRRFGAPIYIRAGATLLMAFQVLRSIAKIGYRKAGKKQAAANPPTPFYILAPQARMPRKINPAAALQASQERFRHNVGAHWPDHVEVLS